MIYEVLQTFHAVGNGTLFTGQMWERNSPTYFNWVYDCGSTSEKKILSEVNNLTVWFGRHYSKIDMLVISHFDDDHVNGLELLLTNHYVKRLLLPYTEWAQSIREISVLGQKGVSPSVALFQLNPARWFEVKNLVDRVGEIVLVQGKGGPDNSSQEPEDISPDGPPSEIGIDEERSSSPNEDPIFFFDTDAADSAFMELGSPMKQSGINVAKITQNQPLYNPLKTYEFIFYNAEKSFKGLGLVDEICGQFYAKKSRCLMSTVKADIESVIVSLGLDRGISSLPLNWRKQLKACYEKHFGHSAKAKNNISLCMYAGPLSSRWHSKNIHLWRIDRPSMLLTGDINLTREVIRDMNRHFGAARWNMLGVIQVPHHGSKSCWPKGNASLFIPALFVQCASGTIHHPHPLVINDLKCPGSFTVNADRKNSVNIHYCYF
ncbi:DNA internalization-related competence protein ComEC/Rec2 [Serratia plymuthica]|uniref:hypothetical protein n=1 Tax=Serratia plymuthica TaxID=82996 RepID=UPI00217743DD|nr:hypothetical protein [Serratia plymuthica]CAI0871708.1 DNA internalization-related competence protein ComEC/Rec2 [Serratia plymuthica]